MDMLKFNRTVAWVSIGLNGLSALLNAVLGNTGWVIASMAAASVSALILTFVWRNERGA